jgi:hypothetical protein
MRNWNPLITEIHQALLRREPMPSELTYWTQHFEVGGNVESMRREIVSSHEFEFEIRRQFPSGSAKAGSAELAAALRRMAIAGLPPYAVRAAVPPSEAEAVAKAA